MRFECPCCGYPTIEERASYDICRLCNWEDDGQDDADADVVRGGPNSSYSLTEARGNFHEYTVMYAPGRDQRLFPDSPLELQLKRELIDLFERIRIEVDGSILAELWQRVHECEDVQDQEMDRRIAEYSERHRPGNRGNE